MQITKHKVVSIDYTLKDDGDNIIDTSEGGDALVYLHGVNSLIPGLETALEGKAAGDAFSVTVAPEDAYGARDQNKIIEVPRTMFGDENIEIGAQYRTSGPQGESFVVTIVEIGDNNVTVDGNHPLAGVSLNFDVKVKEIRDATEEEISHGHVHGPGKDQH